jgi:hypothetical protein
MLDSSEIRDEIDLESQTLLNQIQEQEKVKKSRIAGVRTVLVVMSSKGMVYDVHSLRHAVRMAYPDSAVFFRTTSGKSIGAASPAHVDLLVDLTGPGQRAPFFNPRMLRRAAKTAVGRNSGWFGVRKRIYDKIYDEKANMSSLPGESLDRERIVQKFVLELAGIPLAWTGETGADRGKTIALGLPPMQKL